MNKKPHTQKPKMTQLEREMEDFSRDVSRYFPNLNLAKEGEGERLQFSSTQTNSLFTTYQMGLRGPSAFKPGCYGLAEIDGTEIYLVGELTTDFKKIVSEQKRLNRETGLMHIIFTTTEGSLNFMMSKMGTNVLPDVKQTFGYNSFKEKQNKKHKSSVSSEDSELVDFQGVILPKDFASQIYKKLMFAYNLPKSSRQALVVDCFKEMFKSSIELSKLANIVFHADGRPVTSPDEIDLAARLNQTNTITTEYDLAKALHEYISSECCSYFKTTVSVHTTEKLLHDFFKLCKVNLEAEVEFFQEQFYSVLESITGIQVIGDEKIQEIASSFVDVMNDD